MAAGCFIRRVFKDVESQLSNGCSYQLRVRNVPTRITSRGQVAILLRIRERAGLLPNTDVEFEFDGRSVRIVKARASKKPGRGELLVARPRGSGDITMTTDEIMALTRAR